jgi:WD40 repeat protein
MHSHPHFDNYVLISCDNQLRLFDLTTESTLRIFATRHIEPGIRIEGKFSPHGNYVYCGIADIRQSSTSRKYPSTKGNTDQSAQNSIYIWKTQSGRLCLEEMKAMGNNLPSEPAILARW